MDDNEKQPEYVYQKPHDDDLGPVGNAILWVWGAMLLGGLAMAYFAIIYPILVKVGIME